MDFDKDIRTALSKMPDISLEEMSAVRLMKRTDTKFLANKSLLLKFCELAKEDYFVQEIKKDPIAEYHTTYWDTDDHEFYTTHHNGRRPRLKVRVREYISSETSYLEVKNKDNHNKTRKKRMQLVSPDAVINDDNNAFLNERAKVGFKDIHPCLQNQFKRITLVNKQYTERLTIDYDLKFHNYETEKSANVGDLVIIELKREGKSPSPALKHILNLRIKAQGFSKYCIGSYLTNDSLKGNIFKSRITTINKTIKNYH